MSAAPAPNDTAAPNGPPRVGLNANANANVNANANANANADVNVVVVVGGGDGGAPPQPVRRPGSCQGCCQQFLVCIQRDNSWPGFQSAEEESAVARTSARVCAAAVVLQFVWCVISVCVGLYFGMAQRPDTSEAHSTGGGREQLTTGLVVSIGVLGVIFVFFGSALTTRVWARARRFWLVDDPVVAAALGQRSGSEGVRLSGFAALLFLFLTGGLVVPLALGVQLQSFASTCPVHRVVADDYVIGPNERDQLTRFSDLAFLPFDRAHTQLSIDANATFLWSEYEVVNAYNEARAGVLRYQLLPLPPAQSNTSAIVAACAAPDAWVFNATVDGRDPDNLPPQFPPLPAGSEAAGALVWLTDYASLYRRDDWDNNLDARPLRVNLTEPLVVWRLPTYDQGIHTGEIEKALDKLPWQTLRAHSWQIVVLDAKPVSGEQLIWAGAGCIGAWLAIGLWWCIALHRWIPTAPPRGAHPPGPAGAPAAGAGADVAAPPAAAGVGGDDNTTDPSDTAAGDTADPNKGAAGSGAASNKRVAPADGAGVEGGANANANASVNGVAPVEGARREGQPARESSPQPGSPPRSGEGALQVVHRADAPADPEAAGDAAPPGGLAEGDARQPLLGPKRKAT